VTRATRLSISFTTVVVLGLLPLVAIVVIFLNVIHGGKVTDFENVFLRAAEAVADGENPYPSPDAAVVRLGKAYVYPPLVAIAQIPFTFLSTQAGALVMMALLSAGVVATLLLLDVRDWRCYGMAFLWSPVLSAIQTGNITILLGLGAALTWRFRDRARGAGAALGLSLAAKLILWPLALWLVAARRRAAAVLSLVVGAVVVILSWAVIGFAGLADYPELLQRLQEAERSQGYTLYALALDLGASATAAAALWTALALGSLAGVVVLTRRGNDRQAFVMAIAAALACSPIVWLHYFALLLVAVAVAEPRLGPSWFVPLVMYVSTGTHNGTTLQTAATIAAAALTIAAALRFAGPPLALMQLDAPSPVRLRGSP
jgi:hypothetical protein